jgi:hypothetical protein
MKCVRIISLQMGSNMHLDIKNCKPISIESIENNITRGIWIRGWENKTELDLKDMECETVN